MSGVAEFLGLGHFPRSSSDLATSPAAAKADEGSFAMGKKESIGSTRPSVMAAAMQQSALSPLPVGSPTVTIPAPGNSISSMQPAQSERVVSGEVSGQLSVGTRIRKKFEKCMSELEFITGEPGDVALDPSMAYGEAALTFRDVSFSIGSLDKKANPRKQILAPVSSHFEPGSMVALMGPSGCGKTTLLDILAAKKTAPYEGTIHLNGRPRDRLFSRISTYIAQDDIMPAHLTVQEMVNFCQRLKVDCPRTINKTSQRFFLETRLRMLGLYDVKDTKIGSESVRGISGGQRRRVSLACGLSTMAQMFFADEPTSGLSGTDAEASVRYMRLLAKKVGVTFVVAIHQPRPEVAQLFDHLLLLTANPGEPVYNGPMSEARLFCGSAGFPVPEFVNVTDHFLDLVTPGAFGGKPEHFTAYYQQHQEAEVDQLVERELLHERKTALEMLDARSNMFRQWGPVPAVKNSVYGVPFLRQLRFVFLRQLRLSFRDPLGLGMELAVAVGQSIVIGVTYLDIGKKEAYYQMLFFFMLVMTTALVGLKVMPKLVDERLVVKKETSDALYSDWAYIISFSVINSVSAVIGNTIFIALVFWFSSCPWDLFPVVLFWTTLLSLVMDSIYTMVAAIAKDAANAMTLALPFLTLTLLYNNFTVYVDTLPSFMTWLLWLSPVAYTIEAIAIAAEDIDPDTYSAIVGQWKYHDEKWTAIKVMCICWLVFRVGQVICLKYLNNIKR